MRRCGATTLALLAHTAAAAAAHASLPDASIVAKCNGSPAQQMTFGSGVIKSVADGTCLNATCADFSAAACYPLPFTACGGGGGGADDDPSVQWVRDDADQVFRSVAHNGSACLDVSGGGKGTKVGLYRCDGGAAQTWGVQAGQITTLAEPAMGARCLANGGTPPPPPPTPPPMGPYVLNKTAGTMGGAFDGIGAISGGGATSRLLPDYPPAQRAQILDYLFKPNFGAALQVLKVEVGGDLLTTDGSESSHMHNNHTVDMAAGYEWWLMKEAKARNPRIKLYGLPWAFPGWVGADPASGAYNASATPFTHPAQTCRYMLEWVKGAKAAHGLDIDYLGIWNEAPSDANYVKMLRRALDGAGFNHTRIVANDRGPDICDDLAADADYAAAVDVIGLHYPSDFAGGYAGCHALGKPVWSSEESSSYDDLNGAACWARVMNSHYALSGITSSIMWNLLGGYYPGTSWYASSMLTANQPWSGWYGVRGPGRNPAATEMPVVWATAHVTQFAQVGWRYLKVGAGSGELPRGGFFTTIVDSAEGAGGFALHVVKNSFDHAACTRPGLPPSQDDVAAENVTFVLGASLGGGGGMAATSRLACWHSNFERETPVLFQPLPDVQVGADGAFTLALLPGDFYTISTVRTARHGTFETPVPPPQPRAPLPIADDFDATTLSQQPRLWSQMLGAFEVHADGANATNRVLRQMGEGIPIDIWSGKTSCMPGTVVGMREWQDVSIATRFRLPPPAPLVSAQLAGVQPAACVATRADWTLDLGVSLCVGAAGDWNLTYGGASPLHPRANIAAGVLPGLGSAPLQPGTWHDLNLTTLGGSASGSCDGHVLFRDQPIRTIDTGFAALTTNGYFQVDFDDVRVEAVGPDWDPDPAPPAGCPAPPFDAPALVGAQLYTRGCQSNGIAAPDQNFFLLPDFRLQHAASLLCAEAAAAAAGSAVTLQPCNASNPLQLWQNDYSNIHHGSVPLLLASANLTLVGGTASGDVRTRAIDWKAAGDFASWTFMDSTGQLRSTRTPREASTPAVCLSLCK